MIIINIEKTNEIREFIKESKTEIEKYNELIEEYLIENDYYLFHSK